MRSIAPHWQPAAETMDNRECERSTIRTTTPHSCTIRTATTSKWCAARDREAQSDFAVDLLVDQNCQTVTIGRRTQLVKHLARIPDFHRRQRPRLRDQLRIAQDFQRAIES